MGCSGYGASPMEADTAEPGPGISHEGKEEKSVQLVNQSDAEVSHSISGLHTKEIMGPPLVCVYWNVAGIPFEKVNKLLEDMGDRGRWGVLILLKLSATRKPTVALSWG